MASARYLLEIPGSVATGLSTCETTAVFRCANTVECVALTGWPESTAVVSGERDSELFVASLSAPCGFSLTGVGCLDFLRLLRLNGGSEIGDGNGRIIADRRLFFYRWSRF